MLGLRIFSLNKADRDPIENVNCDVPNIRHELVQNLNKLAIGIIY